jgi:GTP pyrophosphokinase
MIRFEDIRDRVESYHPDADFDLLRRAYVFSAMEHRNQLRKSGEPYLVHPLEVAGILAELKLDVTTVAVGLLHDVLEDTLTTPEALEELFGPEITGLVDGLSKISKFEFQSAAQREAENFRKMMLAVVDDLRVILVKLADRLHNMRTLEHLDPVRQQKIARETMEIYAPIANRLGLGAIKGELEDLSFRYLEGEAYRSLTRRLEERRAQSEALIEEVRGKLASSMEEAGIPAEIRGRIKRLYSICRKMRQQKIDVDEVYDYVAFRILTDSVKNCYGALGIIHSMWRPVPGRIKDYIAMPKPNRYQSLHTSVMGDQGFPFEIQIRTREMDEIAEKGIAAHWRYKEGAPLLPDEVRDIEWLRQLLDWQSESSDAREFLNLVKLDLYPEEVYVFTPRGEVKSLPRGATPIDFAYKVHTEVGDRCTGARVNGRLVPLKTKLQSGDVVEILTAASAHPSRDWLGIVETASARSKIRAYLHRVEREESLELGRAMMERELRRSRLSLRALQRHEGLQEFVQGLGYAELDDLLVAVGFGKVLPGEIIEKLYPDRVQKKKERKPTRIEQTVRKALGISDPRVEVAGLQDGMVSLARCCNPVYGEPIVGYVTRGRGVSVHLEACPNVRKLMYDPRRQIDVAWSGRGGAAFPVKLLIRTEDRQGMLARLTAAIAEEEANIRDIQADTQEPHRGRIAVTLSLGDQAQLGRILERIRSLDGVTGVERVLG